MRYLSFPGVGDILIDFLQPLFSAKRSISTVPYVRASDQTLSRYNPLHRLCALVRSLHLISHIGHSTLSCISCLLLKRNRTLLSLSSFFCRSRLLIQELLLMTIYIPSFLSNERFAILVYLAFACITLFHDGQGPGRNDTRIRRPVTMHACAVCLCVLWWQ